MKYTCNARKNSTLLPMSLQNFSRIHNTMRIKHLFNFFHELDADRALRIRKSMRFHRPNSVFCRNGAPVRCCMAFRHRKYMKTWNEKTYKQLHRCRVQGLLLFQGDTSLPQCSSASFLEKRIQMYAIYVTKKLDRPTISNMTIAKDKLHGLIMQQTL